MAIREIMKIGAECLSVRAREVELFDDRLSELIDDMIDTMIASNGVGLAAPQVGILKRVFVICVDETTLYEFVNPKIIKMNGKQIKQEGCLSIPGYYGNVERPASLIVEAYDRTGKLFRTKCKELFARAVCHENDHLDGILFNSKVTQEQETK